MGMSNGVGTIAGIVCPIVTEQLTKHRVGVSVSCVVNAKLHYTDTGYEHQLRTPPTDENLPHPNVLTCRDVGLWHCDVANLL